MSAMATQQIWAPWRMAYLRDLEARHGDAKGDRAPQLSNFLRAAWEDSENDHAHFVVHRNAHGLIMLNRYPYSNGHVLVALAEARPTLQDYSAEQRARLWELVDFAVELVERALHTQGVNVGINQGRAAGAGLPEHLHVHVVPRWGGDTNFMATIGEVRVVPDSLECSWQVLRAALRK